MIFGLGVGVLVGLTGMGGGSLMTPLLILVFGVKPVTAIGTDLAYGAVTKTVGGWRHWKQRTVDLRLSTWMGVGSVPSAVAGVFVLQAVQDKVGSSFETTLIGFVGGVLILCGAATLAKILLIPESSGREVDSVAPTTRNKVAAAAIGVIVGFVLGVTSAGSGALIAVALILVFRLAPTRVVGTDVFHAAVLLWAAALAHIAVGNVDFGLAANILVGSLPGVWVGSHLTTAVPVAALRLVLGIVLVGAGIGLLIKAGVAIPAWVLLVVLALAAAVIVRARRRERRRREQRLAGAEPTLA